MSDFSWQVFLDTYRIPYQTEGPSVVKGNVVIRCPFCGDNDRSGHMGLSITSPLWGCWKSEEHRGRKPQRLIMALLNCSWGDAESIVGTKQAFRASWATLWEMLNRKDEGPRVPQEKEFPSEFFPASADPRFLSYLQLRGLPPEVVEEYELKGATRGEFQLRVVLPFRLMEKLYGWTGRAICFAKMRYKTCIDKVVQGSYLFNYDAASRSGGSTLVVCEGPFDALNVDWYGREAGIRAVATLGLNLSTGKMVSLLQLAEGFENVLLLLDRGEEGTAFRWRSRLSGSPSPIRVGTLPPGRKDPGELAPREVLSLGGTPLTR